MKVLIQKAALLGMVGMALSLAPAQARPDFPAALSIEDQGQVHQFRKTGSAERVFVVFKVYQMAHYIDASATVQRLTPEEALKEGPSKAIIMRFMRDLEQKKIREELQKSIVKNARPEWLKAGQPAVQAFTKAIDRDAKVGDELAFYWLPDGKILADFNGERLFNIENPSFAKMLWAIWFGNDSVVKKEQLLADSADKQGT